MEEMGIDYTLESILIVDDDAYIRDIFEQLLANLGFSVASAPSGVAALDMLSTTDTDFTFLLTDMKMPEMDGFQLIQRVREDNPDISIIAMTGYSEGYRYVDVVNAGANDFIKKPFDLEELEAKIRRVINERNLRSELSRLSITDSLTGLYNQRHFYARLKDEIIRAKRQNQPLALILLDLDDFKSYNDAHGHLAGDQALREIGKSINHSIRHGMDSGYRYGGDEFAVILVGAERRVAEEIGKRIQESFAAKGTLTVSLGYTELTADMSFEDLVAKADQHLYRSKSRKGR
ncbi:MAG: diguanylate cyclase [Deltaproteobacteria bacterium]|nr:diguanylate cyclase [Deltaproteobacteria bacterium]